MTFDSLSLKLNQEFDLMIDDGLHEPSANIESLCFCLTKVKKGGWVVIEDISLLCIPIWESIKAILSAHNYFCTILIEENAAVFAVKRL